MKGDVGLCSSTRYVLMHQTVRPLRRGDAHAARCGPLRRLLYNTPRDTVFAFGVRRLCSVAAQLGKCVIRSAHITNERKG